MTDDYLRRVNEAYQGESYGEALFNELAARSEDPDQTYKWRVLECLERETKERLRPLVAELGGDTEESPENAVKGRADAENMAAEGWAGVMKTFDEILPKYIRFFEKLEGMARDEHKEVLAAVTAHELAIAEFAKLELAGDDSRSVEPILALLDAPPAAPQN